MLTGMCAIAVGGAIHEGNCESGDSAAYAGHNWNGPKWGAAWRERECDGAICRHLRAHTPTREYMWRM